MNYTELTLKELSNSIGEMNRNKGFWDNPMTVHVRKLLIISEIAEALEADRNNKKFEDTFEDLFGNGFDVDLFKQKVKDTPGDEIADAFIRLMDCIGNDPNNFVINNAEFDKESIGNLRKYSLECKKEANNNNKTMGFDFGTWLYILTTCITEDAYDDFIGIIFAGAYNFNIDLTNHINYKLLYNATRPYKHGKQY